MSVLELIYKAHAEMRIMAAQAEMNHGKGKLPICELLFRCFFFSQNFAAVRQAKVHVSTTNQL